MKNSFYFLILVIAFGCTNKQETKLGGMWSDMNEAPFTHCYATFSEKGDSIFITHYLEHEGRSFFEKGAGIIKGDSLIYHVDVIKAIPEWGNDGGTHYLKLNDSGTELHGHYITDSGNKGPMAFRKVK